jgi:hypothetical protein
MGGYDLGLGAGAGDAGAFLWCFVDLCFLGAGLAGAAGDGEAAGVWA